MSPQGSKVTLSVDGMSCGGCRRTVQDALSSVDGVATVTVSLEEGSAEVRTAQAVDTAALVEAVEDAGFEAAAR